jgi:cell division protein YceG involved in septum cleavage
MPAWQFTLLGRALGKAAEIKAGSYEVTQGITPMQLLEKLTRGDVTQAEVLLEGTFDNARRRCAPASGMVGRLDRTPDPGEAGIDGRQISFFPHTLAGD